MKKGSIEVLHRQQELSSPDWIVREILEGLYLGRYVPGQRLVESDLTREFKVSRGSVREALRRLSAEGVVSLNFNRGAQIRALTRMEVQEILTLLEALIGLAAALAAKNINDQSNKKLLRSVLDRLSTSRATGNFFEYVRARNAFYRALVHIGHNRELDRILPTIQVHLVRTQFRRYQTEPKRDSLDHYRRIAEAVLRGSSQTAETAARRHVRSIIAAIERLPDDAFAVSR